MPITKPGFCIQLQTMTCSFVRSPLSYDLWVIFKQALHLTLGVNLPSQTVAWKTVHLYNCNGQLLLSETFFPCTEVSDEHLNSMPLLQDQDLCHHTGQLHTEPDCPSLELTYLLTYSRQDISLSMETVFGANSGALSTRPFSPLELKLF